MTAEPQPRLIVDPPLAEPLAQGLVVVRYRTEHLRVVPPFGAGTLDDAPRVGHVHVTVDDLPWHFVDASGEIVVLVGLTPGPHHVLLELVDRAQRVLTRQTVHVTVQGATRATGTGQSSALEVRAGAFGGGP
jgi:hypothetical protein